MIPCTRHHQGHSDGEPRDALDKGGRRSFTCRSAFNLRSPIPALGAAGFGPDGPDGEIDSE
jgi:hypothetical protein